MVVLEQKNQKHYFKKPLPADRFIEIFKLLNSRFPDCFKLNITNPLKKGILDDIYNQLDELKLSKRVIRRFINAYCYTPEYMKAHIPGARRVDLDGNLSDECITEFEAEEKNKAYIEYRELFYKES